MNKKNKNKNRSKAANPAPPPQKTEPEPTIDEPTAVVEETTKSLAKESDSVIETISEVSVPIPNESGLSNDTPKKPKRNKGKKKKQDDSNIDDSKLIPSDVPPPAVEDEVKYESISDSIESNLEEKKIEENVTPSTRKKKNKKKQSEQSKVEEPFEKPLITENVSDIPSDVPPLAVDDEVKHESKSDNIESNLEKEKKIEEDITPSTRKKKNKKKQSEQSKVEEPFEEPLITENVSDVPSDVPTPTVDIEVKHESKTDNIESNLEEEKKIEEDVTPSTRKKKNKKKQSEQSKVEEIFEESFIKENVSEDVKKDDILTETSLKPEAVVFEETEPESRQPKKKNKRKKNRNDSEKSDKADDTINCTAAFQKLLIAADDGAEIEALTENIKPSAEAENKETDITAAEKDLKNLIESVLLPEETEEEATKDESTKGKKKIKKDKKHYQKKDDAEKSVINEVNVIKEEAFLVSSTDMISSVSVKKDGNLDMELPVTEKLDLEADTTKSKAKIVKPVEKKRKGKPELPESHEVKSEVTVTVVENITEDEKLAKSISTTIDLLKPSSETVDEVPKITETGSDSQHIISDKATDTHIITETNTTPIEMPSTENIDLTKPDTDMKSIDLLNETNKILRTELSHTKSEVRIQPISSPELIEDTPKDASTVSGSFKTVEKKRKKHPKKIEDTSNPFTDETNEDKVLITPETEIINKELAHKGTEDVFSKLPDSGDRDIRSLKVSEDKDLGTSETETINKETPQKDDIFFDLSGDVDVEISSLKTDDMEGSSDVTPDFIQHPLATSQQLIDENNNMLIREITSSDEKCTLPLLIPTEPIVQGSGETPETEKILKDPTTIRRDRGKKNESEKTDLKSKMMEVNQDMEELRLSIERSLAELTSMEKQEKDVEKRSIESDAPVLGIVTKPSFSKDDQLISEIKSNENVIIENKNTIIPEMISDIQNKDFPSPSKTDEQKQIDNVKDDSPAIPSRKEHKGKGKGKRKGKQETQSQQSTLVSEASATTTETISQEYKQEEKSEEKSKESSQKSESHENKGKQQNMSLENDSNISAEISPQPLTNIVNLSYEPIENFEDALTSSVDDVNKTFEMIANEVDNNPDLSFQNPEINIIAPIEDTETAKPKQNPVSPPKNLLGHPDIPVPSNKTDYKKEKNKPPNMRQAKVKIKDSVDIEKLDKTKQSKESQTENKRKLSNIKNALESFSYMTNENTQYIYKYSFRKVFLQSLCHVCRKELTQRVPCQFCSLVFYCSQKHKDEDWPQHQSLCFAVCTIVHLKDQKHIYADAKHITGHNYRLLRMQMIVSCEKVLKRKLVPWEQEAFLYPRICADVSCREWKQSKLADCEGCEQISYCSEHQDHLPTSHQRWCRSYALYQKLVHHQQTKGRLEPKLPTRVMAEGYRIPEKINEVLASMYDEKIDMNDTEYAALTQLATAPLTAAYCHQMAMISNANGFSKKSSLVIHIVGAELQFEADVLHKWEVFFLHVKPEVKELRVVLISTELNPSNLPLDLLGNVNLCETCKEEKRRVLFSFQDKKSYYEYWSSDDFHNPDLICAFNPSIQRSSMYNGKDTWPTSVSCILKLKIPFVITSYSINELQRDVSRIKECSELSGISFKFISDPKSNPFASVRPDRNFITDDEIPLLFKNYCFAVLCGI